jgi:hypothetical protein
VLTEVIDHLRHNEPYQRSEGVLFDAPTRRCGGSISYVEKECNTTGFATTKRRALKAGGDAAAFVCAATRF